MADLSTVWTLATPGGTIIFNNGDLGDGTDKFWIQALPGLDGTDVRAPIDHVPFGHGSLLHTFWRSGRQFAVDGVLIIETVPLASSLCQTKVNVMEAALKAAVNSLIDATGTFSGTPAGQAAQSYTVKHHGQPKLDFIPIENFALRQFIFGLVSASST